MINVELVPYREGYIILDLSTIPRSKLLLLHSAAATVLAQLQPPDQMPAIQHQPPAMAAAAAAAATAGASAAAAMPRTFVWNTVLHMLLEHAKHMPTATVVHGLRRDRQELCHAMGIG